MESVFLTSVGVENSESELATRGLGRWLQSMIGLKLSSYLEKLLLALSATDPWQFSALNVHSYDNKLNKMLAYRLSGISEGESSDAICRRILSSMTFFGKDMALGL